MLAQVILPWDRAALGDGVILRAVNDIDNGIETATSLGWRFFSKTLS